jgi:hypothetical protein
VQAPQDATPHPNFVPVSFNSSRITHNSGVPGSASTVWVSPFNLSEIAMALGLPVRYEKRVLAACVTRLPFFYFRSQWIDYG